MTPRSRRLAIQAAVGIFLLAIVVGTAWYLRSAGFHRFVRARVMAQLETITGGRVEMGELEWNLSQLRVVAKDLTIHGLEAPDEVPYAHADRMTATVKILSIPRQQVGLRDLQVDKPVIHLIVYPDGRTNQPQPRAAGGSGRAPYIQPFLDLRIDHADVRDGVAIMNDRAIPLDLSANNVTAQMGYDQAAQRYDGKFSLGSVHVTYQNYQPFDASAAGEFTLSSNVLEIKSLRLSSGNSYVEASGHVTDFAKPRASITYRGNLDVARLADIVQLPELRAGTLEVHGSGNFTSVDFFTTGKLMARDVEYRDPALRIPDLDGGAEFTATKNELVLPHVFAHALGGTFSGKAEIKKWFSTAAPAGPRSRPELEQTGSAQLQVQGLSVARFATAVATRNSPLARLNLAGNASGPLHVTWKGAPSRADGRFTMRVTPPPQTGPDQLPVTADVSGTYSMAAQSLQVDNLTAMTRSIHVTASGTMARTSHLQFTAQADSLREVASLLTAMRLPQMPANIDGKASFAGTLSGTATAPELAGRLQLTDLALPIPLRFGSSNPAPSPRWQHFDELSADIRYSPESFTVNHGRLRAGAGDVSFSASAMLDRGHFTDTSPTNVRANVRAFPVNDLLGLAGYTYPLTGILNATINMSGTQRDPSGDGRIQITNATLKGEPFQSISGDVAFAEHEAQLNNLVMTHNGARITGSAAYNLTTTAFRFNLAGSNFLLAQVRELQTARAKVAGLLNFDARGSGTEQSPVINADLHLRDITLNDERLGALDIQAATAAGVMRVTGRSNFPSADLEVDGTVNLQNELPARLSLRFTRLDVDPLLHAFLKGRITGHSIMGGTVVLSGSLREPERLNVTGDINQFSADIEHVRIQNQGPLRFDVTNGVMRLDEFHLVGDSTALSATGTVALTGSKQLNLRANGQLNLKMLETWNPNLHTGGVLDFRGSATGTVARPVLLGQATIHDGVLANINLPNGLSDINGTLVFNQDRMQIQKFTATTGGGTLSLDGFVTYGNVLSFNIGAQGKDVRLRYPQGVSTVVNADLRLAGTAAGSTLSGSATVTRFAMSPQFDVALFLARSKQPPEIPNPNSVLNNVRLSIKVTSTPELQVQTSLAKVTGDVDLTVRGTANRPVVLGRINITEGQVTFNGTNYQLERGDVSFVNPVRTEPVLDVEASTRVRDYEVTLGFHGPTDKLAMTYHSDPPLPTSDIIALLAFGRTREESAITSEPNPTFSESASNSILAQALSSANNSRIQRLFGVSRIKISPEEYGTEFDPNARVTIEQQVSKDFTVTYITDLAHSAQSVQQIVRVEYNYSRRFSIVASRDQYGILAFDVVFHKRKK